MAHMTSISPHSQAAQASPIPQGSRPPLWMPWYGIGFGHAVARFWRKGLTFSGRASRSEYWWAYLFQIVSAVVLAVVFALAETALHLPDGDSSPGDIVVTLYQILLLVPSLALAVRRLHDEDLSGWWVAMPIAMGTLSVVLLVAAAVLMVLPPAAGTGASPWMLLGALVMYLLSSVAEIVLVVLPSRPEGARFDRNPDMPVPPVDPIAASAPDGSPSPLPQQPEAEAQQ